MNNTPYKLICLKQLATLFFPFTNNAIIGTVDAGPMKFTRFQQKIQKILETELPSGSQAIDAGQALAKDIRIGRTAFMDKMGVASELEYKRQCIKNKQVMYHAHIGMNNLISDYVPAAIKQPTRMGMAAFTAISVLGLTVLNIKGKSNALMAPSLPPHAHIRVYVTRSPPSEPLRAYAVNARVARARVRVCWAPTCTRGRFHLPPSHTYY